MILNVSHFIRYIHDQESGIVPGTEFFRLHDLPKNQRINGGRKNELQIVPREYGQEVRAGKGILLKIGSDLRLFQKDPRLKITKLLIYTADKEIGEHGVDFRISQPQDLIEAIFSYPQKRSQIPIYIKIDNRGSSLERVNFDLHVGKYIDSQGTALEIDNMPNLSTSIDYNKISLVNVLGNYRPK